MTTPISEDFLTYAIPLREGVNNQSMIIPEEQRDSPIAHRVSLPAGFHTIQLLWRCEVTPIQVRLHDGSEYGRTMVILPGGVDAKTVTAQFVVAPGGFDMTFVQQHKVAAEQVGTPLSTLGVNFILNPAELQEA